MFNFRVVFIVFGICLLFLLPADICFSSEPDPEKEFLNENNLGQENPSEPKDAITRSSPQTRSNFVISSDSPISMPEVNGSWTQDNWTGGPGQDLWSSSSKYKSSENLNYSSTDGHFELDTSGFIETWSHINDGPIKRYRHRMVWAPSKKVFYVFGGYDENSAVKNTLHEYNPGTDTWTEKGKTGGPSARALVAMAWDSVNDLLWVYAGAESWSVRFKDLWCYNPALDAWAKKADGPGEISYATAVFDPNGKQLIVYGGYEGDLYIPNGEVNVYSPQTNQWTQKNTYMTRMYHDAVWCDKSSSMLVYGGYEEYVSGVGYTYVETLNEYFPNNDTWINRSGMGNRNSPVIAWDSYNDNLILYGGTTPSYNNETWYYVPETDEWHRTLNGPPIRYDSDGGWDTEHNQFVVFGGRYFETFDDYWGYYPNTPAYVSAGELISSVFDPGNKVNPKTISYQLLNQLPTGGSTIPVKIRIAGSADSPEEANEFIGPTGMSTSYFYLADGQAAPKELKGTRYLAYEVNLSTDNPLYSPKFSQIKIDYYTYPPSHTYESDVYEIGSSYGLPLRLVNWTSTEPEGTGFEVYFRQASFQVDLSSKAYEKVTKGQNIFGYKLGNFFQYKVAFSTSEPGYTPVLDKITWTFNEQPAEPTSLTPAYGGWVGETEPLLGWKFNDPDSGDYQTALEVHIGLDDSFSILYYSSNVIESTNNSFRITQELNDGVYYWKVRLCDNYGSWGPWSDVFEINIDSKKPDPPLIECYSHQLEHIWYSSNRAIFDWYEPYDISGIAGYSFIMDRSADTEPEENITMTTDEYNRKHESKDFVGLAIYDKLDEGVWYFHLKAIDTLGTWSDTATKTIMVDTETPSVTDLTPSNIMVGSTLTFRFLLNDTGSGINTDAASLSYRYSSDAGDRFEKLVSSGTNEYTYSHRLENRIEPYIEYYLEVTDKTEPLPGNALRYPTTGFKRVTIHDNVPPEFDEYPGDIVQNKFRDLVITVTVSDNVGVSNVKIFFNDQVNGRTMTGGTDNRYSITIDRVELSNLESYHGENIIYYHLTAVDHHNNTERLPASGEFNITIEEAETEGSGDGKGTGTEEKGFSKEMIVNMIALVIVIIVVALILFMFIRKQKAKLEEDRHKMRMAVTDAHEDVSKAFPLKGIQAGSAFPSLPGSAGYAGDPYATPPTPTPTPQPAIDSGQAAQVPALPEASTPSTEIPPGQHLGVQEQSSTGDDEKAYRDAGLLVSPATPEQPPTKEAPVPTAVKKEEVVVGDGLSVTLPGGPSPKPKPKVKKLKQQ